jgi:hypothetical protein
MTLRSLWDTYWARVVGGSIVLFGLVPLGARYLTGDPALGVYIGTGVAVLWYTVETYYLRLQAVRPLLVAKIELVTYTTGPAQQQIVLYNIGDGPALYVKVQDIMLDWTGLGQLVVRFAAKDVIEAKKSLSVEVDGWFDAQGKSYKTWSFLPALNPSTAQEDYLVAIRYEDVNHKRRESVMQMGKSGNAC